MKTLRYLLIIAISIFLFSISSCKRLPVAPKEFFKPVYVESGKFINDTTFSSENSSKLLYFKPDDPALGKVDATVCTSQKFNGYKDINDIIYVFEKGVIPENINKLNEQVRYNCLTKANWVLESFKYELKNDALFCNKPIPSDTIYYSRLAGVTQRYTATILGNKVYKFKDIVYKEDYGSFGDYHAYIRDGVDNVDLFTKLGISPANYTLTSRRLAPALDSLNFSPGTGRINFSASTVTPLGTFDVIKFTPKTTGEHYILRYVYAKHPLNVLLNHFYQAKEIPRNQEATKDFFPKTPNTPIWTKYLSDIFLPTYRPKFVTGYACLGCNTISGARFPAGGPGPIPPLPLSN